MTLKFYIMKNLISILFLLISVTVSAQHLQVAYKSYGNGQSMCVIPPTINNFIYLLDCSENEFRKEMSYYKYFEEDSQGKYISYWNGSITNFMYVNACTRFAYNLMRDEIRCIVQDNMVFPVNAISDLYKNLKPYYVRSGYDYDGNVIDLFSMDLNYHTYEFYLSKSGDYYDITVLKK